MKKMLIIFAALLTSGATMSQIKRNAPVSESDRLNELYCTGIFKTTDGTIFNVMDNPSAQARNNILEWLVGRSAGYQVRHTRSGVAIPLIRGEVAGIFIDEMPATASAANNLPVSDIAIVKVIRTSFVGNWGNAQGAIAIYTIRGEEEE
jgi:hypothetical protein